MLIYDRGGYSLNCFHFKYLSLKQERKLKLKKQSLTLMNMAGWHERSRMDIVLQRLENVSYCVNGEDRVHQVLVKYHQLVERVSSDMHVA